MQPLKINIFVRFLYSLTNFPAYRNLARLSTGKAITYLLFISLFFGTIAYTNVYFTLNTQISRILQNANEQLPDFSLENGTLNMEGEMPLQIGDKNYPIIIDTSGGFNESVLNQYSSGIFISKIAMHQKTFGSVRTVSFADLSSLRMTKSSLSSIFPLLRGIGVLLIVLILIGFILVTFVSAIILTFIGQIAARMRNMNLPFRYVFRISAHALTLPILLFMFLNLSGVQLRYFNMIYFAVGFFYVWNALGVIKEEIEKVLPSA